MTSRRRRASVFFTVIVASAVGGLLSGCVAGSGGDADAPATSSPSVTITSTASASSTPSGTAAPETLGCEQLLPAAAAASALAVDADAVTTTEPAADGEIDRGTGALSTAMQTAATARSGLLECDWYAAPGQDGASDAGSGREPHVSLRALADAASMFDTIEPDVDDGLKLLSPVDVGDEAFARCADGESDGCRAEVLADATWYSLSIQPRPADDGAITALAESVVAAAAASDLRVTAVGDIDAGTCDGVLTTDQLAAAGLPAAIVQGGEPLSSDSSIFAAATRRSGLLTCLWSSGDGSTAGGVIVDVLPSAAAAWQANPIDPSSPYTASPVDGLGDEAYTGCDSDTCEATVLARGDWITVQVYGAVAATPTAVVDLAREVVAAR